MTYFGCDKENELFVGVCVSGSQNDEAKDQKKVSSQSLRKIWKYYREIFFESFENLNDLPPSAFQVINFSKLINKFGIIIFFFLFSESVSLVFCLLHCPRSKQKAKNHFISVVNFISHNFNKFK